MKNIVLIGFMGTGKTSTGKLLASRIGYSFIDTDCKIEQVNQMTINEMFEQHGESYFRQKEQEMIKTVAAYRQVVISTGGGVVLNPENMRMLKEEGIVISLNASLDVILERTGRRHNRPLLEMEDRKAAVIELLESRLPLYAQANLMLDTSEFSPMQIVDQIVEYLKKEGEIHA